jgi:hypothetical protein
MPQRATAPVWRTRDDGHKQRYNEAVGPRSTPADRRNSRRTGISLALQARNHLGDLKVSSLTVGSSGFAGHRAFDMNVKNLDIDTDQLRERSVRSGVRVVPRHMVYGWVNEAADKVEQRERQALDEEMQARFGFQANISHTANIRPSDVDTFAADFNARLCEEWAQRGVSADIPDNYFDRCIEAGMTPQQCAAYWADGIPLELIP